MSIPRYSSPEQFDALSVNPFTPDTLHFVQPAVYSLGELSLQPLVEMIPDYLLPHMPGRTIGSANPSRDCSNTKEMIREASRLFDTGRVIISDLFPKLKCEAGVIRFEHASSTGNNLAHIDDVDELNLKPINRIVAIGAWPNNTQFLRAGKSFSASWQADLVDSHGDLLPCHVEAINNDDWVSADDQLVIYPSRNAVHRKPPMPVATGLRAIIKFKIQQQANQE